MRADVDVFEAGCALLTHARLPIKPLGG